MYLVSFPGGLNLRKFREMSFAVLTVGDFMCPLGSSCSGFLAVPMLLPSPPPDAIAATAATYNYCCYLQLLLLPLLLLMPTSFKGWSVLQHGLKTGSHSKTFSSRLEIQSHPARGTASFQWESSYQLAGMSPFFSPKSSTVYCIGNAETLFMWRNARIRW